jgi:hypothetical protein
VPDIIRLDTLTSDSFAPARGDAFQLSPAGGSPGATIELRLVEVLSSGRRGHGNREQFAVQFLGPPDPILPQMIYRLEHPAIGILEIFLVPIGRDAAGVTYEAVFA